MKIYYINFKPEADINYLHLFSLYDLAVYNPNTKAYDTIKYTSINKLFLDNMGTTVKNYIITAKIEYAMELIKNTDMLFSEISELVGYSDNFHFSKIFKKHTGFTPTEYKNFSHNK